MYDPADMLELHTRTHLGFGKLLAHCAVLSAEELRRELTTSGYPTVQLLLHHIIEGEHYWIDVAADRYSEQAPYFLDRVEDYPDVASLERYNDEVRRATANWLAAVSAERLNTPREHTVWGGEKRVLLPVGIVMRVLTHHFHHRGQLRTMFRLLDHPAPEVDFPVVP